MKAQHGHKDGMVVIKEREVIFLIFMRREKGNWKRKKIKNKFEIEINDAGKKKKSVFVDEVIRNKVSCW